ncbi:DinB family protein [Mucilaginibacter sp. HD30]
MDKRIDKIKKIREFLLREIAGLSEGQLNTIPAGYNNNIIWNINHLISAQQGICYRRMGQTPVLPDKYLAPFGTNTKPDRILEVREIDEVKGFFLTTIDRLQEDFGKKIFTSRPAASNYKVYEIDMYDIDDALDILLYHEGYHAGQILRLKKLVEHIS